MRTVFFDVDTQFDFLFPAGALYARGAELILPNLEKLTRYAAMHGIPIVSSADAHLENDAEFREWPPHCVAGTLGQRKTPETVLDGCITVAVDRNPPLMGDARQVIVEKQSIDVFTNPNLSVVLERFQADRYVVYGVVTEVCVRCAAFGLLKTGKPVEIVTDAVRALRSEESERVLRDFQTGGGALTTTDIVCA